MKGNVKPGSGSLDPFDKKQKGDDFARTKIIKDTMAKLVSWAIVIVPIFVAAMYLLLTWHRVKTGDWGAIQRDIVTIVAVVISYCAGVIYPKQGEK